MYERQFGLQRRPFLAKVSQSDVFVGPQTAQTMASLRKALQVQDAIVAVSGPTGSGKSTLVGKAIEAIADTHAAVRVGRMSLQGTDLLEFLLEELGATALPKGPIRQFTALRERLGQFEADNRRVVVVVEDARRLGVDTLAELEALTAADAGDSAGAAIVVMGDEDIGTFLDDPQLARFVQRIRHRHAIQPLSEAEMRGYFMHCFRRAGGDFDKAFDKPAVGVIRSLCNGIPRMANNVAEAAMSAAAAAGTIPVSAELVAEVALREFGLEVPAADPDPVAQPVPEAEPACEPAPSSPVQDSERPAESIAEAGHKPTPVTDAESLPELPYAFGQEPGDEIPELIQDTLPDLEVLAPEIDAHPELERPADTEAVTEAPDEPPAALDPPVLEPEADAEPEPEPETDRAESGPADLEVPDWDRDPTMAELRPDLDALEQAMALVREESDDGEKPAADDMPVLQPEPDPEPAHGNDDEIPEITLDNAINERVQNNLIDEKDSVSRPTVEAGSAETVAVETPELRMPQRDSRKADAELERIAAELARAKTLEDVDDKLAETLFGEELSLAAAEVVARVRAEQSANDEELSLADTGETHMARAVGSSMTDGVAHDHSGAEIDLGAASGAHSGLDLSASQRLNTVRSLGAGWAARPADAAVNKAPPPAEARPAAEPPAPIEDQINTSMTQTLKALNVKPPTSEFSTPDDDDGEEEKKRGFFGRFRRS